MPKHLSPVAIALLLVLLGCANSSSSRAATRPLPVVQVSDARDGGTVGLHLGQRLRVVLHSTYWEFKAVGDPAVLHLTATPAVAPKGGCVPGQGCGTVTAVYVARALGRTTVKAARTSCGEAMGCTGGAGGYTLTVVVMRGARSR
jgi:hypothetical protein